MPTLTKNQLIAENKVLRARSDEASEMLKSILGGEVDAIVVSGEKGAQVYSISSAETPYRTFVEEMHEGALTLTKEGIILFSNRRFAELVKEPVEKVTGSFLKRFIAVGDRLKLATLLATQTPQNTDALTVCLLNSVHLKLSFHLLPDYIQGDNYVVIATDITEMKKKEKELADLHYSLEQHHEQLKSLRIDLINRKFEDQVKNDKLTETNKKLNSEIARYKKREASLTKKPSI